MAEISFVLKVVFYCSEAGNEPVREWLKQLSRADKRQVGEDIKTAQLGWPVGMPLIRKIDKDLCEVRTGVRMALPVFSLPWTMKKSQKTPQKELETAIKRLGSYKRGRL